jgi:FkbM family methyltransferase
MDAYEEIWIERSYDVLDAVPDFVVDAGAHIGLASAFFASRFPGVHLFSIEPDDGNFRVLSKNLQRFPNVTVFQGGLWGEKSRLRIANKDDRCWSYTLETGGEIPGITVDDILVSTGRNEIDVLKMDIEGAEQEVLATSKSWIHRVNAILIELHDRKRPGCSAALAAATNEHNFVRSESGEYVILKRAQGIQETGQ